MRCVKVLVAIAAVTAALVGAIYLVWTQPSPETLTERFYGCYDMQGYTYPQKCVALLDDLRDGKYSVEETIGLLDHLRVDGYLERDHHFVWSAREMICHKSAALHALYETRPDKSSPLRQRVATTCYAQLRMN